MSTTSSYQTRGGSVGGEDRELARQFWLGQVVAQKADAKVGHEGTWGDNLMWSLRNDPYFARINLERHNDEAVS